MENGTGAVDTHVFNAVLHVKTNCGRRDFDYRGRRDCEHRAQRQGSGGQISFRTLKAPTRPAHIYFERGMFALKVGAPVWGLYNTA